MLIWKQKKHIGYSSCLSSRAIHNRKVGSEIGFNVILYIPYTYLIHLVGCPPSRTGPGWWIMVQYSLPMIGGIRGRHFAQQWDNQANYNCNWHNIIEQHENCCHLQKHRNFLSINNSTLVKKPRRWSPGVRIYFRRNQSSIVVQNGHAKYKRLPERWNDTFCSKCTQKSLSDNLIDL